MYRKHDSLCKSYKFTSSLHLQNMLDLHVLLCLAGLFLTCFAENETYDFIIIGAGSAGSVIATRLSENPDWSILLLEAGTDGELLSRVPIAAATAGFVPGQNWNYLTETEDNACLGSIDRKCDFSRGKALGGTSVVNFMIYSRGNKLDYDSWAERGNTGWSYEEVLPYFRKSERTHLEGNVDEAYHSRDGVLGTSFVNWPNDITQAFLEAGTEVGYNITDYNGESQVGFSDVQSTTENGERVSTATAFLYPVLSRTNLHVIHPAFVTKILIDNSTRETYGVQYDYYGSTYVATATKEVISSAGPINSVQLLSLSGIGPKEVLEELDIPLIQDLPVGKKMYDHLCNIYLTFTHNSTSSNGLNPLELFDWLLFRKGSFTSLSGITALGYVNTTDPNSPIPDIELILATISVSSASTFRRLFRVNFGIGLQYFLPLVFFPSITIAPMLFYPKSYGYIKIASKDPYVHPIIKGNYYSDEGDEDLNAMLRAAKLSLSLTETDAFKKYAVTPSPIPLLQCAEYELYSDDYLKCLIKHGSISVYHPVATTKMGPPEDLEAVVNPELKVYGVKKLRVVDSGIIPSPVACHTNAPAIMIAEKAADLIKEEWSETA